ncbi:hypothetical protein [Myxacorys almedinensis]|uniref:Uncharacterized protein n=1 Tax=Myxacorys almedinensis A TaxID=2690445 RepID=A0A8J7YY77_9CYAN|nr:hypothetical protein [Myxacorys almedinensis]NDJ16792.1 hypothetical protein [Myxacorys almedinensis A]
MSMDDEIRIAVGIVRLWLLQEGLMDKHSTAIALQQLTLEIQRNIAIVGDGGRGRAENSPKDVISSDGLNLVNISSTL